MAELTAQRTLVKSPPELWAELSELEGLAKHLGELGEIRITKVEPETTVAWEGEQISGTVELEQSGWGTKVTLTATVEEPPATEAAEAAPPEAPAATVEAAVEPEVAAEARPAVAEAESEHDPEPAEGAGDEAPRKRPGFLRRWLFRQRTQDGATEGAPVAATVVELPDRPPAVEEPGSTPAVEPDLPPAAQAPAGDPEPGLVERTRAVFDAALENLGQAHHRPFSRG